MQMSPVFDRDGLLVMRRDDQSLWRSTDQGDTWTAINGPWGDEGPFAVTTEGGYVLRPVTFSPAFAQDGVLLARAGDAIYRSTDTLAGTGQGGTWTMVLNLDRGFASAVFSPDYARDGTIYLLQDRTLYRSTDRGQKWQALPPAPWASDAEIQMQLSPVPRTTCCWPGHSPARCTNPLTRVSRGAMQAAAWAGPPSAKFFSRPIMPPTG
jgi:hypothetical protein